MRIQVVSDIHREFGSSEISFQGADLVVLAGDIDLGTKGMEWIKSTITKVPVIYILGNHEYYKGSYPKTLHKIMDAAAGTNIHVLENRSVVVDDVTFHGATLWTDFALFGEPRVYGSICQEQMSDYKMIRLDPSYSRLRSIDTSVIHRKSVTWLESSLAASTTDKNIVVTHHAPSPKSLPEQYKEEVVSSAYASNLEAMINQYQPQYWIHGHIHTPTQYAIGNTTIICNPQGYIHEPDNGFNKTLVIHI